jgi:hypothetical protein
MIFKGACVHSTNCRESDERREELTSAFSPHLPIIESWIQDVDREAVHHRLHSKPVSAKHESENAALWREADLDSTGEKFILNNSGKKYFTKVQWNRLYRKV